MITLENSEKILLTVRKHWLVLFWRIFIALILGAAPILLLIARPTLSSTIQEASLTPLILLISCVYWMVLLLSFFIGWLDYWLDAWIITNVRLIKVEQKSLFHREVSEFLLSRIENVTTEIPGFIATFFKFGNITVETAGEMNFQGVTMCEIEKAKDIIMEYGKEHAPRMRDKKPVDQK